MSAALATVPGVAAQLISAAALVSGALVLLATRRPTLALAVLLDLLTAAGLLHLAADPGWSQLVTAAAVIGLRHLIWYGLRVGSRTAPAAAAHRPTASPGSGR